MKRFLATLVATAIFVTPAWAGSILIVNGLSGTSEVGTTTSITDQMTNLHEAVGNTVTVSDGIPIDFTGFDQIWDLRFSNTFALSVTEQQNYVDFMASGGGMFVMGENSGFTARNDSVIDLIALAGGGNLNFAVPTDPQTVNAPFTGPNPVATIDFAAPGGVDSSGTGQFITEDAFGRGTGVAWGVGDLANAQAGALTVVFDVNFMQLNAGADREALAANLVGFVGNEVDPPAIPLPASLPLLLAGLGITGLMSRRQKAA